MVNTQTFDRALAAFPDGTCEGVFNAQRWGATVKRSADHKRMWLYAEDLSGTDIVSFNLYRLTSGVEIKPCEMSLDTVIAFVLGFRMDDAVTTGDR
ncbi:hypothetical protein [Rhizobium sp. CFBP 8762]|uniref:hypothetical protein n=1 Tax=Rhizobium sp. CFBP 8762 TaxID=2775279 RepID=UPI001FD5B297|nr:hypothetical protein [Rhizobium sp. CFBP 8762]